MSLSGDSLASDSMASDVVPEPATIDGCQVVARIDGQVVLACELLWRVNLMLEANRDRIPPNQYEAVRDQLMKRTLTGMIDQKLLYAEFKRNIPPENMPRIEENLLGPFQEREVPRLMEQLEVKSSREVEQELSKLGSSLADTRQSFNEQVIASEWIRSKLKDKISDEVSPQEMVDYYRDHRVEFEFPTQGPLGGTDGPQERHPRPGQQEAYAPLAQMGNKVWPRVAANPPATHADVRDVAKAKSQGSTRRRAAGYDWTTKGSLKATVVDDAIFSLPVGQMSPILDSGTGFHIVRVLERTEAGCRPFSEVQNDIRDKLKDERMTTRRCESIWPNPPQREDLDHLHRRRVGRDADGAGTQRKRSSAELNRQILCRRRGIQAII